MRSFENEATIRCFLPNSCGVIIVFLYAIFSANLPVDIFLNALKFFIFFLLFLQFICAIITNHLCYHKVSVKIKSFYSSKSTITERTHLFDEIIQYPLYTGLMTFFYFFFGGTIIIYYLYSYQNQPLEITGLFTIEALYGTYFASLFGYSFCSKIVRKISIDIINAGIERNYVLKKKIFGISFNMKILLFIIIPCIFTSLINCSVLVANNYPFNNFTLLGNGDIEIKRMFNTIILNIFTIIISISIFYKDITSKNEKMSEVLSNITSSGFSKIVPIETDISDEFSFNHYLINQIISMLRCILFQTEQFGKTVAESSSKLMRIANETDNTFIEQSNEIKEIVSTMEKITNHSHNIEYKIRETTQIAKINMENVNEGSNLLNKTITSISSIVNANELTIQGIKKLDLIINSIWEISNIIDSISDQTKIIAFNAELESSTKNNENFTNIANEIRKLANSTIDNTKEIKSKINAIQLSSEKLTKASKENSDLIKKETEYSKKIESNFLSINNSAKYNYNFSNEIKYLIEQQTKAFDEIIKNLHEIDSTVQNFTKSTRALIETSRNLQENVNLIESANISYQKTENNKELEE